MSKLAKKAVGTAAFIANAGNLTSSPLTARADDVKNGALDFVTEKTDQRA